MRRCRICNVPLSGFLSGIPRLLFKVSTSGNDATLCNKCEKKEHAHTHREAAATPHKAKGREYKCQICGRLISEEHALAHAKAEEYLLKLIRRDHPRWDQKSSTCPECIEYYRKLIKETEI